MPLLLALVGCDRAIDACPAIAHPSVQLDVLDDAGQPLPSANVQFSLDGGALQDCESWEDGTYVCGWSSTGDFVISIEAEGFESQELEATVVEIDACTIDSQFLEVELEATPCTEEIVPAVIGTVPLADDETRVFWEYVDHDAPAHECAFFDIEFQCADEISGDLHIWADDNSGGFAEAYVTVEHDGCHPITQEIELELEWGDQDPEPAQ